MSTKGYSQYSIELVLAGSIESVILAEMNLELIKAENSNNPMDIEQLTNRMRDWLAGGWNAHLILVDGETAGYALWRDSTNEDNSKLVYLRQFFVKSKYQRMGVGTEAFRRLVSAVIPPYETLELDVLESNPGGREFWCSVGMEPCYTRFRLPESTS